MYSSSSGDAPSAAAALNGRDSAFSMPSDHSTALWERQALGRDKFDRERYTSTKRDWTVESRSSYRSSSGLSASGSLSASFNKRRAIGRHETVVENGRYRSAVGRASESSTSLRSPPQIGKAERDMCSPGYGGSPIMDRPSKALDGHHYRDTHLSPGNARPLSSPRFDSRLHGNQNDSEGMGPWDRERTRFSSPPYTWDAPNRGRDYRERAWSRPDYRRACPLPKLDSSREWSQSDRELLEGRIDRYSSVSGREIGFSDVLSANSREHTRHDWRGRDRILQSGISSQIPAYPSTNSLYNRDSKNASLALEAAGAVVSPQHSPMQSSFSHESDQDCGPSTKKRPRLTWGQGLAKYEKEKTGEDFSAPKKSEEGSNYVGGLHSDGSVASALLDGSLQMSNVLPYVDNHHPCKEQKQNADTWAGAGTQKEAFQLSCRDLVIYSNEKELLREGPTEGKANAHINASCNVETGSCELAVAEASASQSSILEYMQSFLNRYQLELPNLSKEVLTLHVEKVEFEIDRLEKEIAKLETVHDIDTLIPEKAVEAVQPESKCEVSLSLNTLEGSSKPPSSSPSVHNISPTPVDTSATMISTVDVRVPGATVLDIVVPVLDSVDEQEVKDAVVHQMVEQDMSGVKEQSGLLSSLNGISDTPSRMLEEGRVSADFKMSKLAEKDLKDFIASLLASNQEIAEQSTNALAHLQGEKNGCAGTSDCILQESSVCRQIAERHDRIKTLLEVKVTEERRLLRFAEGVLAVKYRAKKEAWKQEQSGSSRCKDRDKCFGTWDPEMKYGNTTPGRQSPLRRCPLTTSSCVPEVNNEGSQTAKRLVIESPVALKREYLRMPPMVLGQKERSFHMFATKNALVEDPVAAEQERKAVNPWSAEERRIFLDKYSLLGKNLRKIASFLEHKSVADCVQFFYQNQKTEEFEKIHRRHQLKKRRDCRASALYLATTTSVSSRHREENAAYVEGLSLVAAAAAAMSVPRDLSRPARSPVMKPYPLGSSSSKTCRDSNLIRQASSASTLTGKDSNVEHLGGKCAQNTHSRSLKRPPEDVLQWRSQWNDHERDLFMKAVVTYGKDFDSISSYIGTKSLGQCKTYFSKARKRLGLDQLVERHAALLKSRQGVENLPKEIQSKNADLHINGIEADSDFKMRADLFEQQLKGERSPFQVNSCMASEIRCNSPHENQEVISALSCPKPFQAANCTGSTMFGGDLVPQSVDNPLNQGLCSPFPGRTGNVDVSGNFLKSGASSIDGLQVCSNDNEEALQIKKEPLILKAETSSASHISAGVSKLTSPDIHGTSSSAMVAALMPGSHTAASVVQSPQMKDKGIKTTEVKARREPTSWTQEEKEKFIEILKVHGKNWDLLCKSLPAKSLIQIKTYFQNSKAKLGLGPDGVINNPGRAGSSWKRKVDDSDSSSNAGSAGQMISQKAAVPSDDGSLKASPSILAPAGGSGSNMLSAEALAYANIFGRKLLEESICAQKAFHAMGLSQNLPSPGILPMLTTVFSQPNLISAQQPYMHTASTSMKIPQIVNHQQPEQSLSSLMVVEPSSSVGVHQTHLLQPQQQVTQDPTLQSAHKQSLQIDQKALLQHVLPPNQQLQQMAEAVLQQLLPQAVQRHQPQMQLAAQQAPHHFQQVLNHQSNWQSSQASSGNVPVSMSTGQQKQQQSVLSQAQLHQMHGKVQAFLQQHQQVPQLNQLQLLQLQRQQQQQQQLLLHLQQAQALSQSQQIQNQTPLMQQSHNLSNEQQQQGFFRGFTQSSSVGVVEGSKQNDFDMSTLSKFQQGDVYQPLVLNQTMEAPGKPQIVLEHSPAGDVKLFGQSLLSQPTSISQHLNAKTPSSSPAVSASSALSTGISAATIACSTPAKVSWDHVIHGQAGQQITRPNVFSNGGLTCTVINGKGDSISVQEIVSGTNERLKREARDINSGKMVDSNYIAHVPQVLDGSAYPTIQTNKDNCTILTSTSLSCGPSIESLRCENENEKGKPGQVANHDHLNVSRKEELNSVSGNSGGEAVASQGLPRVLDALVALAEWRLQNSSGCSGKLTDEFLSQSWEALQKDPGSLIEAGKASGSLSQLYAEGPQMLQHLRERLVSSHSGLMQASPGSGSTLGSALESAAPINDGQNLPSQALPSHINVCDPGRSDCLTTEANGGGLSNG